MFLNHDEIENEIIKNGIIENYDLSKIDNVSYKCRIGKIILPYDRNSRWKFWADKKKVIQNTPFKLGPSEIVIVETLEKINLPSHLGCLYSIPQSRAQQGLLLLNASIVEPNYNGKLSCYLINISQKDIVLSTGKDIAKIIFFGTTHRANANRVEMSDSDYTIMLKEQAINFGRTFLNINEIQNLAAKKATIKVNRSLTIGGIVLAFLLIFASLQPLVDNYVTKRFFGSGKIETGLLKSFIKMEEENLELKITVEKNNELLDSLINVIRLNNQINPKQEMNKP